MADLQPPEDPISAGTEPPTTTTTTTTTILTAIVPPSTEHNNNNNSNNVGPGLAPKRQRRPSVRLGEIGYQPATLSYESQARRPKPWRFHRDPSVAAKTSKTRPLTNLVNNGETLDSESNLEFVNPKLKSNRPTKRVRTNWSASKIDNNGAEDEELREFENVGSESPMKEQSPVHSIDNVDWNGGRGPVLARVSVSRENDDDGMPESNSRGGKCRERNFVCSDERVNNGFLDDGVRNWLIGLGLGRYAPVFEIHEVDDEILPMLTLEDLKDMGINAVGSRRKLFSAIQKLQKRFS